MEFQIAGGTSDKLLSSLDFTLSNTANYVQSRRSVSWCPTGAGTFAPNGVRVLRFNMTGEGWCDLSTLRIQFAIRNTSADANEIVEPVSGPHCFIDRIRVLANSTVIEDIQYYARTHEMLADALTPFQYRVQESMLGFGTSLRQSLDGRTLDPVTCYIGSGNQLTVLLKPALGLLRCGKAIPLRYCPLQFEIYLANADKAVKLGASVPPTPPARKVRVSSYEITNCQVKVDLMTLDSGMENNYASILTSNKELTWSQPTYITQMMSTRGDRSIVALTRALTRLRCLFLSFSGNADSETTVFRYPKAAAVDATSRERSDRPLQLTVQLGSKLFPENPIASTGEFVEHLRKCLGIQDNIYGEVALDLRRYEDDRFIVGISMEKVLGSYASLSGLNTKTGDLLTIKLSAMQDGAGDDIVERIWVTHVADIVVSVTDSGVSVYD